MLLRKLGIAYAGLSEPRQAIKFFEQSITILQEISEPGLAQLLVNLGSSYIELGEVRRGIQLFEQALPTLRELGELYGQGIEASTLNNLGMRLILGDLRLALTSLERALSIQRETGD